MKAVALLKVAELANDRVQPFDGLRPYVATGDLDDTGVLSPTDVTFEDRPSRADLQIRAQDVCFARMKHTEKVRRFVAGEEKYILSTGFAVLRPRQDELNPDYLYHWLRSNELQRAKDERCTGAIQPAITNGGLGDLTISLPPLEEQRRIASILDAADELSAKRQQAIDQLDNLTQATFIDMFGDPLSNPRGWSTAAISELGAVSTGKTPSGLREGMYGSEVPFVTPGDLESMEPVARWLSKEGASQVRVVPAGSALVCCIGATIGKVGVAHRRSTFNQQINAVDWDRKKVVPNYGFQVLRLFSPEIARLGVSTTLPILKKSSFEKLELPCPPRELQEKYSTLVEALTLRRVQAAEQIAQFEVLFASLQQRAFRGDL